MKKLFNDDNFMKDNPTARYYFSEGFGKNIYKLLKASYFDEKTFFAIQFSNDVFHIPPTKTFMTIFESYIKKIVGSENEKISKNKDLSEYEKIEEVARMRKIRACSIGAFWGFVFQNKEMLGYDKTKAKQKNVSVYDDLVKKATYFPDSEENLIKKYTYLVDEI